MTSEAEILGCEPTEIPEIPGEHGRFAAADQTEYGQSEIPALQLPNSIRSAVAVNSADSIGCAVSSDVTSTSAKPSRSSQCSSPSDVFLSSWPMIRLIIVCLVVGGRRQPNAGSWHNTLFAAVIDDPLCFF
jgi:hypothetical protein